MCLFSYINLYADFSIFLLVVICINVYAFCCADLTLVSVFLMCNCLCLVVITMHDNLYDDLLSFHQVNICVRWYVCTSVVWLVSIFICYGVHVSVLRAPRCAMQSWCCSNIDRSFIRGNAVQGMLGNWFLI